MRTGKLPVKATVGLALRVGDEEGETGEDERYNNGEEPQSDRPRPVGGAVFLRLYLLRLTVHAMHAPHAHDHSRLEERLYEAKRANEDGNEECEAGEGRRFQPDQECKENEAHRRSQEAAAPPSSYFVGADVPSSGHVVHSHTFGFLLGRASDERA